ncbi:MULTISPECIES: septation protein A [unclassified Colwellia]|uniref:septation protein A n=1 Tax=unclassified Colwellia TaxID=196834 RepID=UPI0015F6A048|nr:MULTISPECIES: septation protein A [unclassified Colwellia]MBA6234118.1 septation protein A [Colwellia sp. MB02u-7]MBA6237960.1 septation protein A [Colwellia sp. MB02u-11]MBA6257727.1 septation protein A [Colwellia sp. MB3u-28]MBA6259484.1 septation protein A [Colwellia sp. MB3u-41]MBA6300792.1 septation protein A [Colwellia sp. MB3u-22]
MHALFEYLPLVVFFIVYKFVDIYWATGSLIILAGAQIIYYLIKKETIPKRTLIFFVLIAVFGGLTIFLHDDTFLKWKVTIINLFFAIALLVSDKIFKKNIIKDFLNEALSLPDNIWGKLNLAWALFFALCAVLNLYVAFNFDQDTWVNFKVFGLTALMFVFSIGSVLLLSKHLPDDEDNPNSKCDKTIEEKNNRLK